MTLLVKNVLIADREKPERTDILVRGDKIAAIGNLQMKQADEVYDGQGSFISSGFIDSHSIADRTLDIFKKPDQENYVRQGVTSVICGQGGLSLAPLVYGELKAIREWADLRGVNIDWRSLSELLKTVSRIKPGVNFGTLTGYTTLREAFVGDSDRNLTKNENSIIESLFRKSMSDGSLGISMGMGSLYGKGISMSEARSLMRRIRKDTVQTFEFDESKNSVADLEETLELAVKVGAKLVVNGLEPLKGREEEFKKALELFKSLPDKAEIYFSISPRERKSKPLFKLLPDWAQRGSLATMAESLGDEWLGEKIYKELSVDNVDDLVIVNSRQNAALNGLSLRDYAGHHGQKPFKKALFKLMQSTKLDALVTTSSFGDELIAEAVKNPRSLISSSEIEFYGSPSGSHGKAFVNYLEITKDEPLANSIRKVSTMPAKLFGLNGRGTIREGAFADLTVFKSGEVKFTVVNGEVAFKDGSATGSRSGSVLKGNV